MRQNLKNFKTLAFAGDREFLKSLTSQLDGLPGIEKKEEGSPRSSEGHVITYSVKGKPLFFAMIHSSKKHYLIRADKNLFEVA